MLKWYQNVALSAWNLKWVNEKLKASLKNLKWLKLVTEKLEVVEVGQLKTWSGTEKLEVVEVCHWKTWSGWSGSLKNLKWLKWVIKKLEVVEVGQ